jgi:hypothetical protein
MMRNYVAPAMGRVSFHCAHCGAFAHQVWYSVSVSSLPPEKIKEISTIYNKASGERGLADLAEFGQTRPAAALFERLIIVPTTNRTITADGSANNLHVSYCVACRNSAVWVVGKMVHPVTNSEVSPSPDLPEDVKEDFNEAALIVDASPRGAAALLRLALQKLVKAVGGKGENINVDIGELARKGLPVQIQQALDIVRVVGNNAVHPGEIDLRDDRDTAIRLFQLINLIADAMITQPRNIEAMFGSLPAGAREAIDRRDKQKDK